MVKINHAVSALDRQRQIEVKHRKNVHQCHRGGQCQVWKWDAFRVFCGYRHLLLPKMGQRARISIVFAVVFCIFALIYSVMWFTFFVYTLFWLNPSDWFIFLSRDCFYILGIKAHVIFPTPASNSRRRAFARNVEILLIFFR
jgi:hypothetical protein